MSTDEDVPWRCAQSLRAGNDSNSFRAPERTIETTFSLLVRFTENLFWVATKEHDRTQRKATAASRRGVVSSFCPKTGRNPPHLGLRLKPPMDADERKFAPFFGWGWLRDACRHSFASIWIHSRFNPSGTARHHRRADVARLFSSLCWNSIRPTPSALLFALRFCSLRFAQTRLSLPNEKRNKGNVPSLDALARPPTFPFPSGSQRAAAPRPLT